MTIDRSDPPDPELKQPFVEALQSALGDIDVRAAPDQIERLYRHFHAMVEANRQFNLTRITDPRSAAIRLYADSAAVVAWARQTQASIRRVVDVGSGAGFPAVPMAVLQPEWDVIAVEGTRKKADFIGAWAVEHQNSNLHAVHAHTEHWTAPGKFHLATFKAVGRIAECLRLAQHLIKKRGYAAIFKSERLPRVEEQEAHSKEWAVQFHELPEFRYTWNESAGPAHLILHVYQKK